MNSTTVAVVRHREGLQGLKGSSEYSAHLRDVLYWLAGFLTPSNKEFFGGGLSMRRLDLVALFLS